ncbi:MAG: hypothetical protein H3C68_08165 [Deltaproteobacteria bacterium]|nr:hypothetical protein [Deltaproteobacteria bacterium]MBZ0219342.1 hypothetical protein [Deltaproteobacteria bacterium]
MTGYEIVAALTDNIEATLRALGINFNRKSFELQEGIPAGLLPLGEIFYAGESFEQSLGQGPGYAEAGFLLKVIMSPGEPSVVIREEQKIIHAIRDGLTVDALNTRALSEAKSVSGVRIERAEVTGRSSRPEVRVRASVRYRVP